MLKNLDFAPKSLFPKMRDFHTQILYFGAKIPQQEETFLTLNGYIFGGSAPFPLCHDATE